MARQQTNKIIREEKKIAKGRGGTIHQGHFSFIVSFLLSSRVFLFVLFISPFGRFGVWCVVQRGGIGDGGAFRGVDLLLCVRPCLCNYIPQIPTEGRGWAIIGSTMRVIFHYSFILVLIMSESAHGLGLRSVWSCHRRWLWTAERELVTVPSSRQICFYLYICLCFFFSFLSPALKSFLVHSNLNYYGS